MRIDRFARGVGAVVVLGGAVLGGAGVLGACEEDPHRRSTAASAGECTSQAGKLPEPNCDNSEKSCSPEPGCSINEAKCGSKSTCLPMVDNKGKSLLDFRIRRLNVAAPKALAQAFIQKTVVTTNIDLQAKECGELGKGLFTWLLSVDRTKNEITTGGAPPPSDPFGKGFCFANFTTADGIAIAPITAKLSFTGETFKSTEKKKLNVPIFISPDPASVIVLPITDVTIEATTISAGGNCIGSLNLDGISAQCTDDPATCSKWNTAGSLGGFITLEEADGVFIQDLTQSLCVVLTQSTKDPATNRCKRENGKIAFQGDFCSTDRQPGSCKDSVWMAATFAAAAVKVFDGAGVPACSGAGNKDGGVEGGAADGGGDAATDAKGD